MNLQSIEGVGVKTKRNRNREKDTARTYWYGKWYLKAIIIAH